MKKLCKIHRPHIMWLIVLGEDYHDYCYPSFEVLIDYILKKYDISYEDMDVLISTEYIDNSDVILDKVCMKMFTAMFRFDELDVECEFGNYFCKEFSIDDSVKKLYFKVVPLENFITEE